MNPYIADRQWSESHGAIAERSHIGVGAIYQALTYAYRAKRAVCLGSGSGFVPMCMAEGQRALMLEGLLTDMDVVLVDANTGPWDRPTYNCALHPFDTYPHISLLAMTTNEAACMGSVEGWSYLHVDADHSYEQCYADLVNFDQIKDATKPWAITVHDTWNVRALRSQYPSIGTWRAAKTFAQNAGYAIANLQLGCGTALITAGEGIPE